MTDQAASIGLVIRHGRDRDPVASAIVRAIAGPLLAAGMRFITRSVDDEESELRTYRLWARVGGIAGVIVLGRRARRQCIHGEFLKSPRSSGCTRHKTSAASGGNVSS